MYVQYKVNVSENPVDILKYAIRLKKGASLCFPEGDITGATYPSADQSIGQGTGRWEMCTDSHEC